MQRKQQKELINITSKISTYTSYRGSGYSMQALDDSEIICYDRKIYVLQSLHRRVIYWYHIYINHPSGIRLVKTTREVCYWKGFVIRAEIFVKTSKTCQQFKNRKTLYGDLPPKNIAELKPWDLVHVDLIGPYRRGPAQDAPFFYTSSYLSELQSCRSIISAITSVIFIFK